MGCQSLVRIATLPSAKNRKLFRFAYPFLQNPSSAQISLLGSRPSTNPSPPYNGANGYNNGGGPPKDYFSTNPRLSQQSHLASSLRPGSSRSTASPSTPHSSLYPQDDPDPPYGWRDQTPLSRGNSARPPLPPKIPSQPTQIYHMPEPTVLTDDVYTPHPESGGPNGTGPSMNRNDSSGSYGSYVLPPLPHQAYPPGRLVNPHTDSPSCKELFSSQKA
jgi:hypothetical protein